jgi:hypothetical protein
MRKRRFINACQDLTGHIAAYLRPRSHHTNILCASIFPTCVEWFETNVHYRNQTANRENDITRWGVIRRWLSPRVWWARRRRQEADVDNAKVAERAELP